MNKSETTDRDLLNIANKLGLHIDNICYVDQLPDIQVPTKTSNYILNLRNPAHWVGLHIRINGAEKKGYYFNSFSSLMSIPKEVIHFLRRCGCYAYYDSDKALQDPVQGKCGQYTLDFLLYINRSGDATENYESFLNHLHHSTNNKVMKYIKDHM